jgi:DNA-directed RNA polymerase specialized sigma24 family protein
MSLPMSLSPSQFQPVDELMLRVKAGDQAAWTELYAECFPKLIRAVRKKMGTSRALRQVYDSADIANDVWKSLAASWESCDFPNQQALMSHLLKEANRKFIDRYRNENTAKKGKGRTPLSFDGLPGEGDLPSDYPTPSAIAVGNETWSELTKGRSELEIEILRQRLEGHSTESISKRTGVHEKRIQRLLRMVWDTLTGS